MQPAANPTPYNARHAWLRAAVYFAACLLIAGLTGTLGRVLGEGLISAEHRQNPSWWLWTVACCTIIGVGYLYVWPRGTRTHGRPRVLSAIIPFGIAWGISEGLLFVSVWAIVFGFFGKSVWTVLLTFLILAAFIGLWHQFYWDIWVAPDHNIVEWNARKVAFAHTPNLLASLMYLTLFESLGIVVLLQTIALLASTYYMRFPPFWEVE